MRIIAGTFRGYRLPPIKHLSARPTTDFAKENLFNVLVHRFDLSDFEVLDLFAGTGSISLEFVSRGVKSVTAVEKAHTQQQFITSTCNDLKINNLRLVRSDVFHFLSICKVQYDCIFADPPYSLATLSTIPDIIFANSLLKTDGLLILEHSKEHNFATHPHFVEERTYGSVHFSFFQ